MDLDRHLDEAVRTVEQRRYRRLLTAGRLPLLYGVGVLLAAFSLFPFLFGDGGLFAGSNSIMRYREWPVGTLFTTVALAAGLAAYFRAHTLWQQEHRLKTLNTWLLTRQEPARVAATTIAMSAVLGVGMVLAPLALALILGLIVALGWWQFLLSLLLVALCSLLGGVVGACVSFAGHNLVRRRLLYPALLVLAAVAVGLWLRIETVENGWKRSWEEHPSRMVRAVSLLTPAPAMFGVSAPEWWAKQPARDLGWRAPSWAFALAYGAFLLGVSGYGTLLAASGYLRLANEPDREVDKPREVREEAGQEFYWKGFKNPVWTRDIRTRLRSRETAEFIFFASIAVAAGAFVPLLLTARDLSDPLQTARAARHVFFWLTMTLVALVSLIAPGLTAEVVVQERESGTLEMLIGTPMRPRDILIGKLLGAICVLLLLISPSLPLFGLCYLFHGASEGQVLSVYLLLIVTLTVSAFIGLAQSAINVRSGAAKFWAYAVTLVFVACPGGPFMLAATAAAPQAGLRQALMGNLGVSVVVGVFLLFGLGLMWGNASEQLEYSEF